MLDYVVNAGGTAIEAFESHRPTGPIHELHGLVDPIPTSEGNQR